MTLQCSTTSSLTLTTDGWNSKRLWKRGCEQRVVIEFVELNNALCRKDTSMPIRAGVFFDMFPFCVVFEVRIFILFSLFFTAPRDKHRIKLDRGRQGQARNSNLELYSGYDSGLPTGLLLSHVSLLSILTWNTFLTLRCQGYLGLLSEPCTPTQTF